MWLDGAVDDTYESQYVSELVNAYLSEKVLEWVYQIIEPSPDWVFCEVDKETLDKVRNAVFEDKWGIGSCVYLWSDNSLSIGID